MLRLAQSGRREIHCTDINPMLGDSKMTPSALRFQMSNLSIFKERKPTRRANNAVTVRPAADGNNKAIDINIPNSIVNAYGGRISPVNDASVEKMNRIVTANMPNKLSNPIKAKTIRFVFKGKPLGNLGAESTNRLGALGPPAFAWNAGSISLKYCQVNCLASRLHY